MYQADIAVRDILGEPLTPADYRAVPRVTFTDPEIAAVGLTERAARDSGISVRTGSADLASRLVGGSTVRPGTVLSSWWPTPTAGFLSARPRWVRTGATYWECSPWRYMRASRSGSWQT